MRLLPKSEVDKAKASDRQREIDEGKKLATKVDTLRELHAEEEKGLEQFRQKTVKQIREEIDPLIAQKEALTSDISELEHTRKMLLVPLDAKWEEVNAAQTLCDEREADLATKEGDFNSRRALLVAEERELHIEKERVVDERERSKEMVASSGRILDEANQTLVDARAKASVVLQGAQLRHDEAIARELRVAAQERDNSMVSEHLRGWDNDLVNRERALKDRYETLLRTAKRLNLIP